MVLSATGASAFHIREVVQQLYSGFGNIVHFFFEEAELPSVIVKQVLLRDGDEAPISATIASCTRMKARSAGSMARPIQRRVAWRHWQRYSFFRTVREDGVEPSAALPH